jgi:LysM repeat protein
MAVNGITTGTENAQGTAMSKRGQTFWNAYANIKSQIDPSKTFDANHELLTYIQADPRYVDYHQMYVDSLPITAEERLAKQAEAVSTHYDSNAALNAIDERGAYDTDVQGAANDFYFLIEQNYPSTQIAEPETAADVEEANATVAQTPVPPAATPTALPLNETPLYEHLIVANYTAPYETVAPVTATINNDEGFDADWAAEQFGPLAETPEEEIIPNIEPIAPEVVPEPFLWTQEMPIIEPEIEEPASILQFQTQEPVNDFQEYTVEKGDNLWNIAKNYYGFGGGDDASIMEAVTKISIMNGLEEGTNANNLRIGQELKLPDSPSLSNWNDPDTSLDWVALDAQTASRKTSLNLGGNFDAAVHNKVLAPLPAQVPAFRNDAVLAL